MDSYGLPLLGCFALSSIYVASLYIWNVPSNRDDPNVILKRSISVIAVTIISPYVTRLFLYDSRLTSLSMWELHGFRTEGLWQACVIPLFLTAVLFLGPLCLEGGFIRLYRVPMFWVHSMTDPVWWRNYLIAPFSEEFTFRACMIPLLVQSFRPMTCVLICPPFFGLAHVHHMIQRLRSGMPWNQVLLLAGFQLCYTTLFGAYSALLFIKTGHFIAPFLAHSFCNLMGFPDIDELFVGPTSRRKVFLIVAHGMGVVLWCLLLPYLTAHGLYSNDLYTKF